MKAAYKFRLYPNKQQIGVDVGLKNMVALSTGETVQYPRYYAKTEKKLTVAQRDLSRRKLGSNNRQKAKIRVARIEFIFALTVG